MVFFPAEEDKELLLQVEQNTALWGWQCGSEQEGDL